MTAAPVSTSMDTAKRTFDGEEKRAQDRAAVVVSNLERSVDWLKTMFYPKWAETYQNYLMEGSKENPTDEPGNKRSNVVVYGADNRPIPAQNESDERIRINTPNTYSMVTRRTARATAQLPTLRHRSSDQELADRVGRLIMHQWDVGVQSTQARHVLQAELFGISVRAWSYAKDQFKKTRHFRWERIAKLDDQHKQAFLAQYGPEPLQNPLALQSLAAQAGLGGRIPIDTTTTSYIGPRADYLFVGDCFFYPRFQTMQSAPWFICMRRRNRLWFEKLAVSVGNDTAAKDRIESLLRDKPNGSDENVASVDREKDGDRLRRLMTSLVDENGSSFGTVGLSKANTDPEAAEWVVTEIHYTGPKARCEYVHGNQWLCELRLFDLDGKIPFTEMRSGVNLLHGIGDPPAQLIRKLQRAYGRTTEQRIAMADAVLRPKYWTNSRRLLNEPQLLKRYQGMDVMFLADDEKIDILGEQAAMAAIAVSNNEESGLSRLIQETSGETNMSLSADVDPKQAQTATGSKLMARTQDILTRQMLGWVNASIREDAQMMYMLNATQMDEDYRFDGSPYKIEEGGQVTGAAGAGAAGAPAKSAEFMTAAPEDFQGDAIVEPEIGSTLAEDDEGQVVKANTLFGMAMQAPQQFNIETARNRVLRAYGEGGRLAEWVPPPPQGPPPAAPLEPARVTISAQFVDLPEEVRGMIGRQVMAAASASGADNVPPDAITTDLDQSRSEISSFLSRPTDQMEEAAETSEAGLDETGESPMMEAVEHGESSGPMVSGEPVDGMVS